MKKTYFVVTIALACFLILGIGSISFGQEFFVKDGVKTVEGPKWVPGEIIVKFKPGVSDKVIDNINLRHGSSVISINRFAGFKRLRIPTRKTVADMVEIYKKNPNVEYSEPNFIAHAFLVPNDYLGDVIGDLNSRRGKVKTMTQRANVQVISAQVPLSSMFGYATDLRSKTQGRATYTMQFSHYDEIPKSISENIIVKARGE